MDADQVLTEHVLSTLPDSISRRREVILALRAKITAAHPAWKNINAQLAALDTIDELQAKVKTAKS
ncbi:MAG TPA: hypothetical protein VGO57_09590 [Verrucomicrobiae bacterium]|jgi:hypothetical protein